MEESSPNKNLLEQILLGNKNTKIIEILSENPTRCQINILGETKISSDENLNKFILKINKKKFDLKPENPKTESEEKITILDTLHKMFTDPKKYFENDIYSKYCTDDLIQNKINVELIYPATQKQIDKFKLIFYELVSETYDMYLQKTLPFIKSISEKDIKWIYDIFEKKVETPIGEAPSKQFQIFQDYKVAGDNKIIDCLGLPILKYSYLKSIRDLTEKELPLLEEFYTQGKKIIAEKYGCKENEIKAFLHYPPSFYYLHVHYLSVNNQDTETNSSINRAIDLGEIIQNIKLIKNYYQLVTIDHTVQVGSKLYNVLKTN